MDETLDEAQARLWVVWNAGQADGRLDTVDHVAGYARSLVAALRLAGYRPRRLEVGLRSIASTTIDLDVHGDVPGLDQAGFARLASVAIGACQLWQALGPDAEIRLRPRLDVALGSGPPPTPLPPPFMTSERLAPAVSAAPPAPETRWRPGPATTRVGVALAVGLFLGLFGLPRFSPQWTLPMFALSPAAEVVVPTSVVVVPTSVAVVPTSVAVVPTSVAVVPTSVVVVPTAVPTLVPTTEPTRVPTPTARIAAATMTPAPTPAPRVRSVLAETFAGLQQGWPSDPDGTAWFANSRYELMTRDTGHHVAIGAPLDEPLGDVVLSGRFRKTGGPAGGGYGFIVRDQGTVPLDGEAQGGRYIVLEVGDRGDVGIWQREENRWIDILPWSRSLAVRPGEAPNELAVTTRGNRLLFVVNGVEVANLTHNGLPPMGRVGLFVGGDENHVAVDYVLVDAVAPDVR